MDTAYFDIDLQREHSACSASGETCASDIILSAATIDKLGNTRRRRTKKPESGFCAPARGPKKIQCRDAIPCDVASVDSSTTQKTAMTIVATSSLRVQATE